MWRMLQWRRASTQPEGPRARGAEGEHDRSHCDDHDGEQPQLPRADVVRERCHRISGVCVRVGPLKEGEKGIELN